MNLFIYNNQRLIFPKVIKNLYYILIRISNKFKAVSELIINIEIYKAVPVTVQKVAFFFYLPLLVEERVECWSCGFLEFVANHLEVLRHSREEDVWVGANEVLVVLDHGRRGVLLF